MVSSNSKGSKVGAYNGWVFRAGFVGRVAELLV